MKKSSLIGNLSYVAAILLAMWTAKLLFTSMIWQILWVLGILTVFSVAYWFVISKIVCKNEKRDKSSKNYND